MIRALFATTQVIGSIELDGATHEVCVEANATHDRLSDQLTVNLRAFLRATKQDHIGEVTTPAWLPAPETVIEAVDVEEAHAMANDIFASWRHKVAESLPA